MDVQFTKGPWRHSGLGAIHSGNRTVALVGAEDDRGRIAGWQANAALIASAPDLLAALEEAADILESYIGFLHHIPADDLECHPYIPSVEQAYDEARAAIAKARLSQPPEHG